MGVALTGDRKTSGSGRRPETRLRQWERAGGAALLRRQEHQESMEHGGQEKQVGLQGVHLGSNAEGEGWSKEAPGVEGSSCGHAGGRSHGRPCPEWRKARGSPVPSQTVSEN